MPKYCVHAQITISVLTEVEAPNPRAARATALGRSPMTLCHQCATGHIDSEWVTSGELDGLPTKLCIERIEEDE